MIITGEPGDICQLDSSQVCIRNRTRIIDWDYTLHTETDLHYNSSEGISRVAELAAFAPKTFADMRGLFGISEDCYRTSILGSGPFVSFQSNSKGAARVGGIFFFTRDGAYMIKTIKVCRALSLKRVRRTLLPANDFAMPLDVERGG